MTIVNSLLQPYTNVIEAARSLTVTPGSGASAVVTLSRSGVPSPQVLSQTITSETTFGPYNLALDVIVTATAGSSTATLQDAPTPAASAPQFVTGAAAAATVAPGVTDVILDSINGTAFALTFPVATVDKQALRVLSGSASTALTVTGSGDGSTIKNAPAAVVSGTCFAWQYRHANTTWYRQY